MKRNNSSLRFIRPRNLVYWKLLKTPSIINHYSNLENVMKIKLKNSRPFDIDYLLSNIKEALESSKTMMIS